MDILTKKLISVGFIVLLIIICLAISYFYTGSMPSVFSEGFEIMDVEYDRPETITVTGEKIYVQGDFPRDMYKIKDNPEKFSILPTGSLVGPMPYNGIIPEGYYRVSIKDSEGNYVNKMAKVPNGYIANLDKTKIFPITTAMALSKSALPDTPLDKNYVAGSDPKNKLDNKQYNSMDLNADYNTYDAKKEKENCTYIKDATGEIVCMPNTLKGNTLPTYYQPGTFVFSSSNYVPNYEDSVYLSLSTGLNTLGKVYTPSSTSSSLGGFCNSLIKSPLELEQKCLATDTNTCASTSCCVLLGGAKCVSGNASGPTMKANYSDTKIPSRDFYYFNGKCYGNCM